MKVIALKLCLLTIIELCSIASSIAFSEDVPPSTRIYRTLGERTTNFTVTQENKKANKKTDPSTESRLQEMLKRYPEADANRDGVLSMDEAMAHRSQIKGGGKSSKVAPKVEDSTSKSNVSKPAIENNLSSSVESFENISLKSLVPSRDWDSDGDRKLSKDEFKAPKQLFTNLDLNADGFLDEDEVKKLDAKLNLDKSREVTWIVPPEKSYHGVTHHTYRSQSMNTDIGYCIYLPDDYSASDISYPVIYHLHGSGGNESVQIDQSAVYHKAITESKMPPVIIVFVNGGRRSYYSDSPDGKVLAETTIIRELIPHIDSSYRTLNNRWNRVIEGFSMGGFGACKLALKYPELFGVCLSFSGGIPGPESVHQTMLESIMNGDKDRVRENQPAELAKQNRAQLNGMQIWLFAGSRDIALEESQFGDKLLTELGIEHRFETSPDTGHTLKRHFEYYGEEIFAMLSKQFKTSDAIDRQPVQSDETLDTLMASLHSTDAVVRLAATRRLLALGDLAKPAYPALIQLLVEDEAIDIAIAAETIYATPRSSRDALLFVEGLQLDTKGRVPSAWALSQMGLKAGSQSTDALLQALEHTDKHERNFVTIALAMIAKPSTNLTKSFVIILKDPGIRQPPQLNYKYPRAAAALAIGLSSFGDDAAVPALIDILERSHDWEYQQAAACFALGQIGGQDAMAALQRATSDSNSIVRKYASQAIEHLKPASESSASVEELIRKFELAPNRVDTKILFGLTRLGSEIQSSDLGNRKGSRRQALSAHESIALAIGFDESKSGAIDPKQILADQNKGNSTGQSQAYIAALGGVQQSITPALLVALSQSKLDPRAQSIRQLGMLGSQARLAIPFLQRALEDRDWIVRREAAFAIDRISQ